MTGLSVLYGAAWNALAAFEARPPDGDRDAFTGVESPSNRRRRSGEKGSRAVDLGDARAEALERTLDALGEMIGGPTEIVPAPEVQFCFPELALGARQVARGVFELGARRAGVLRDGLAGLAFGALCGGELRPTGLDLQSAGTLTGFQLSREPLAPERDGLRIFERLPPCSIGAEPLRGDARGAVHARPLQREICTAVAAGPDVVERHLDSRGVEHLVDLGFGSVDLRQRFFDCCEGSR
jgi:hypothetical protein